MEYHSTPTPKLSGWPQQPPRQPAKFLRCLLAERPWLRQFNEERSRVFRAGHDTSLPESEVPSPGRLGYALTRIGLEAGPLSQWLYAAMKKAGLAVELLETRHVRDAFKAMPVKSDRNDARGIAQLMRLGWF